MRYLIGTKNYGLFFKQNPTLLEGFCDADWNIGYVFTLGGGAVCWKSKKQTIIANYTIEDELIALVSDCEEAIWLRDLLFQIPYFEKPIPHFNSL